MRSLEKGSSDPMSPPALGTLEAGHLCGPAPLASWGADRVPGLWAEIPTRAPAGRAGSVLQDPRRREGEGLTCNFLLVVARPQGGWRGLSAMARLGIIQSPGPEHQLSAPRPHLRSPSLQTHHALKGTYHLPQTCFHLGETHPPWCPR